MAPRTPPHRSLGIAAACLLAFASIATAHHPFVVPRLDGVTPCVDGGAVELHYEPSPDVPASAGGRLAADLDAAVAATLGRYAVPIANEDACVGTGTVRFAAELRWLDPTVYRGYPDGAHGLLVVLHVGDEDIRFQSAASELFDPAAAQVPAEERLVAVVTEGAKTLARAWWTANPPAAVVSTDRRPMAIGLALAALVAIASGVTAWRRRALYGRGSKPVRASREGAPGRPPVP